MLGGQWAYPGTDMARSCSRPTVGRRGPAKVLARLQSDPAECICRGALHGLGGRWSG